MRSWRENWRESLRKHLPAAARTAHAWQLCWLGSRRLCLLLHSLLGPSWAWLSQVKVTAVHGLADYPPAQLPPLHTELPLCDGVELCPIPAKLPSLHP